MGNVKILFLFRIWMNLWMRNPGIQRDIEKRYEYMRALAVQTRVVQGHLYLLWTSINYSNSNKITDTLFLIAQCHSGQTPQVYRKVHFLGGGENFLFHSRGKLTFSLFLMLSVCMLAGGYALDLQFLN